ncbi:MerR family transcriptional regulator [Caldimonas tepidiphila]|uniref:MerR family transcriptional regulator n=1 Tax=Caldimonas tepidiphila TaxID=2315841 RepID=UPI000E5B42A7|nr:MerR family transcriptional regulator [Caldimonas tepidiphila]
MTKEVNLRELSIADVERDTGLGKDTLRVWERRYGFPQPGRDALGERSYAPAQVEKLRVIKRLMDAGHRPGQLVSRSLAELQELAGATPAPAPSPAGVRRKGGRDGEADELLALLGRADAPALRHTLLGARNRLGLRDFVIEFVAPLATRVGEAWMRGELRIYEEHLFTECVQAVLHEALLGLPPGRGSPRVLLATMPGEPHGLGLLMAQALLALEGAECLSLGVQVPLDDIAAAAAAWRADIVALSVTGCMKRNLVLASLAQLREQLPGGVALWVGGGAPALGRRAPEGLVRVAALAAIGEALSRWRERPDFPA